MKDSVRVILKRRCPVNWDDLPITQGMEQLRIPASRYFDICKKTVHCVDNEKDLIESAKTGERIAYRNPDNCPVGLVGEMEPIIYKTSDEYEG